MEVDYEEVTKASVLLAFGMGANVFFLVTLCLSWKTLRLVKYCLLLLTVGNWLELAFRHALGLVLQFVDSWPGNDISCKMLMMMKMLGTNLANMAVATLALHAMFTVLTGSQGSRLRHGLLLCVCVVLSLPLSLSKLSAYGLGEYGYFEKKVSCRVTGDFFLVVENVVYVMFTTLMLVFLPTFLFQSSAITALIVSLVTGNTKVNGNFADVILTWLMGLVMMLCELPLYTYDFVGVVGAYDRFDYGTYRNLDNLEKSRTVLCGLAAGFYVIMYKRFVDRQTSTSSPALIPTPTPAPAPSSLDGEQEKMICQDPHQDALQDAREEA